MRHLALSLLIILCMAPAGHAHRFYASFSQINVKSDTLQITHRLFTHDVEDMLEDNLGPIGDLSKGEIEKYLRTHIEKEFSLYDEAGKKMPLSWIGYEYKVDEILVFQETPLSGNQTKFSLANRLLMDIFRQQKNTVNAERDGVVRTVIFQNDSGREVIDLTPEKKKKPSLSLPQ